MKTYKQLLKEYMAEAEAEMHRQDIMHMKMMLILFAGGFWVGWLVGH